MWNYIKIFQNIVNQSSFVEQENLYFILVLSVITATIAFILKVHFIIHKEKIAHQIFLEGYRKILIASKNKIDKEKINEECFDEKQAILLNDIDRVKSQWVSLNVILNSLRKS